ncbi:protein of unknown function DUF541 [Xylanimonas cellulosilytica DSM 15894]|uniref:SIMPL domain-containing protein n=1 Tax=Xylanimonas cellulosilytica (strain DSM 15894 / JCM 12276 / CECT 5975 / KCTC 9989 / LMG 20990 / NBRC 107835 / XIL07) TaxID=446471 RepID=D1BZL0_XYLCX|nr:SIMPL domain-containing protein [Xylanimonas cellulosilytica]ACZ30164.1 protein of unknown function DUF541 [Xylanimonas cellulosilytica DSM 15894]
MVSLAVHGSATRTVAPELGTVHLAVTVTADARADALAAAQEAHAAVVALARGAADAGDATGWTAPEVHAWAFRDWVPVPVGRGAQDAGTHGQPEQATRYRAGGDVQVTFTDAAPIAELVGAVGAMEHVDVQRVAWDLTAPTRERLLSELRAAATRDAVVRAADYAAALGLDEPRVVALYEDGLHPGLGGPGGGNGVPRLAAARAMSAEAGFELRPAEIEVTASVTVQLEALPG